MTLVESITTVFDDFSDPRKRIFVGYLALSFLIALMWLILLKRKSIKAAFRQTFDPRVLLSGSSIADYKIFVINRVFTLFISPLLLTQLAIATAVYYVLHDLDGLQVGMFGALPEWAIIALYSVTMFVVDDFTKYLVHRWMHHWPLLWAIHQTHHSATTLTPITVYRIHPLEGVLYGLRGTVAQGTTIASFLFFFGDSVDLYTVLGVNVIVFVFHVTGSNLRHSHIHIRYWRWLEYIVISPAQHQLHHSTAEKHFDKNFGVALAIWDWMFGSLHHSEPEEELTFGLDPSDGHSDKDLTNIYLKPFMDIYRITARWFSIGFTAVRQVLVKSGS